MSRNRTTITTRLWSVGATVLLILSGVALATFEPPYIRQDLGTLGGSESFGTAINNLGQAVGISDTSSGDRGFLYLPEAAFGLSAGMNTLQSPFPGVLETRAHDLNDWGDVVGQTEVAEDTCQGCNDLFPIRPVRWIHQSRGNDWTASTVAIDLDTDLGLDRGTALGINELTEVTGDGWTVEDPDAHFGWLYLHVDNYDLDGGVVYEVPKLSEFDSSYAVDINENGLVVGNSWDEGGSSRVDRGYTWDASNDIQEEQQPLDEEALYTEAFAINDEGKVVGSAETDTQFDRRAVLWEDGEPTDLGALPNSDGGAAFGINQQNEVVGENRFPSARDRGFYWKGGTMHDLNMLAPDPVANRNANLDSAGDINERGQTIATHWIPPGESGGNNREAVILHPLCPNATLDWSGPPDGTIDARQPHPVDDCSLGARQGIGSEEEPIVIILSETGAESLECWALCETGIEAVDSGEGCSALDDNAIASVTEIGTGVYEIVLDRPISAGYWTQITYLQNDLSVWYASLPGDANGSRGSTAADITAWINYFNDVATPPHHNYSMDIDHSGTWDEVDLDALVDLLNGEDKFIAWINKSIPAYHPECGGESLGGGGSEEEDDPEAFAAFLIEYVANADPQGEPATALFESLADAMVGWVAQHFTGGQQAAIVEALSDPELTFASDVGAAKAAEIVELLGA